MTKFHKRGRGIGDDKTPYDPDHTINSPEAQRLLELVFSTEPPRSKHIQQQFCAFFEPFVRDRADKRARSHRNDPFAQHLTANDFLSVGMEGLLKMIKDQTFDAGTTAESLRNLCSMCVNRRFMELERDTRGRKGRNHVPAPHSLNAILKDGSTTWADYLSHTPASDGVGCTEEMTHILKTHAQACMTEKEYLAFATYVDKTLEGGHKVPDIAAAAGFPERTYRDLLKRGIAKLQENYPYLGPEMHALLAENEPHTKGVAFRF